MGCLICAVGLKLPVMYGGMYGASYILYGAAHTCMVRAVLDILYLQYTSIGAIPVPVLDLDILWASEFVLWV